MKIDKDILKATLEGGHQDWIGVAMAATLILKATILQKISDGIYVSGEDDLYQFFPSMEEAVQYKNSNPVQAVIPMIKKTKTTLTINGRDYGFREDSIGRLFVHGL